MDEQGYGGSRNISSHKEVAGLNLKMREGCSSASKSPAVAQIENIPRLDWFQKHLASFQSIMRNGRSFT